MRIPPAQTSLHWTRAPCPHCNEARWLEPDVSTWLTSLVSNLTAASDGGRAPTIHEGHFNAPER